MTGTRAVVVFDCALPFLISFSYGFLEYTYACYIYVVRLFMFLNSLKRVYLCVNSKFLHANGQGNIEAWELVSFFPKILGSRSLGSLIEFISVLLKFPAALSLVYPLTFYLSVPCLFLFFLLPGSNTLV